MENYGYHIKDGMHTIYLWSTPKGVEVWASASTLEGLLQDPRIANLHGQVGTLIRLLTEEQERKKIWICTPERRVYGPGQTRDECEEKHAAFLRSGYSKCGGYHHITSLALS